MSYSNGGGRRNRNIRDNLFVVYASINDVINGNGNSFDIQGYDVIKCFDEMWYTETLNDLWDVKVQDDIFCDPKLSIKVVNAQDSSCCSNVTILVIKSVSWSGHSFVRLTETDQFVTYICALK